MTIDRQPRRRRFQVVGSAGSISAASDSFAVRGSTQIRSHLVSFNLMANTGEQLDFLRRSLDKIADQIATSHSTGCKNIGSKHQAKP
jgi:hypothetical protein